LNQSGADLLKTMAENAQVIRAVSATATEKSELVKGLGLFDATMIVSGSMIGSGIFIVSADIYRASGKKSRAAPCCVARLRRDDADRRT
jgi:hypothetical protein